MGASWPWKLETRSSPKPGVSRSGPTNSPLALSSGPGGAVGEAAPSSSPAAVPGPTELDEEAVVAVRLAVDGRSGDGVWPPSDRASSMSSGRFSSWTSSPSGRPRGSSPLAGAMSAAASLGFHSRRSPSLAFAATAAAASSPLWMASSVSNLVFSTSRASTRSCRFRL